PPLPPRTVRRSSPQEPRRAPTHRCRYSAGLAVRCPWLNHCRSRSKRSKPGEVLTDVPQRGHRARACRGARCVPPSAVPAVLINRRACGAVTLAPSAFVRPCGASSCGATLAFARVAGARRHEFLARDPRLIRQRRWQARPRVTNLAAREHAIVVKICRPESLGALLSRSKIGRLLLGNGRQGKQA